MGIIQTARLCSPRRVVRRGREWVRFPLRIDQIDQQVDCSDNWYQYDGRWWWPHEPVAGFHNTRLESLIGATHT